MWQTPHKRNTLRGPFRVTQMGLLACAVAVLLTGVVIGRVTAAPDRVGNVYLRESQPGPPSPSADALATARRDRPPLEPVARTEAPQVTASATPVPRSRRERPSTMIDGSGGGSSYTTTLTPETGGESGSYGEDPMRFASMEAELVRLVNIERRRHGCGPLRVDPRLVTSARAHSEEMAAGNRFRHTSPGGATPWDRMGAAGYRDGGAETIARGYDTAEQVVRGWMAGPTDRATLLNCRLVATGVGVSAGPGGPWWTEDFGYS
ncbi:CAP domain-containing protein [Microbispora cellulosiformans]|uniref:CAP domain-containing protein n=2 Tax=Microbispora cellulosiformans TaxID=2614688 RepID=A0A5J5KA83_9ACTN|nr:CAP domain-containing protein [Microbispora cellulosiformans]